METFPQPRTIPEAWDISDMIDDEEAGFELPNTADDIKETGSVKWANH
jgi:hypothetical protein